MTIICYRSLATVVVAVLAMSAAATPVYKTVDSNGNVSYSDVPDIGTQTQELELPPVNIQLALPPSPAIEEPAAPTLPPDYRLRIDWPEPDSTIPPGQIEVEARLHIEPALAPAHWIQWLVDDEPQGEPTTANALVLTQLIRGSHQLRAIVMDSDGVVLAQSEPVTIHVRRASAKHPRRNRPAHPVPTPPSAPTPIAPP